MKNIIITIILSATLFTACQQEIVLAKQNFLANTPTASSVPSFAPTRSVATKTTIDKVVCQYNGKHQSNFFDLKHCDESAQSCYHYLIEEKKATDFTIINWLYEGMEVEVSGKGLYQSNAKDKIYFELEDNIELRIITRFDGLQHNVGQKGKQYLVFSAVSLPTSTTVHFLLESSKIDEVNPALKGLSKNEKVKISGYTKSLGAASGHQYVELISNIKINI